jgi:hypothetical protein
MNNRFDVRSMGQKIVYVKTVKVADLPEELRLTAGDRDTIVSVHNEQGQQLALVTDRGLAFDLARQHDMTPMTVH